MEKIILILVALLFSSGSVTATPLPNKLAGKPVAKASCDVGGCTHEKLSEADQAKYSLAVSRPAETYFWTSRENRKLEHSVSGAFDNYINSEGQGYIRVAHVDGHCLYVEHLTMALQTVTYWGECQES